MVQRKAYRVDQLTERVAAAFSPEAQGDAVARHYELILEIRALRSLLEPRADTTRRIIDNYEAQIAEFHKLKAEMDLIQAAIKDTKREIATLHVSGFKGRELRRVTDELDAVVGGTADATDHILGAAEEIERCVQALSDMARTEQDKKLTREIVERVVQIFESCNFHDLLGQRIAKVGTTLKVIEAHIVRMMEIWGGIEALKEFSPPAVASREGDRAALDGPNFGPDASHVSQDDIDALFS